MYDSFEEWIDVFIDKCYELGYDGNICKESFESDYENGACPYQSAEDYVNEMNS